MAPDDGERDFSAGLTRFLLDHIRSELGDDGVNELISRAGSGRSATQLVDSDEWLSYSELRALFEAGADILGGAEHLARIAMLPVDVTPSDAQYTDMLQALGTPGSLYANMAATSGTVATVVEIHGQEIGPTEALVTERFTRGLEPFKAYCWFSIGLLAMPTQIYGLAPAEVTEEACQCDGAPFCRFRVRWSEPDPTVKELAFLRVRTQILESHLEALLATVAELVSGDDIDLVLDRIIHSVSTAVRAPAYVLALGALPAASKQVYAVGIGESDAAVIAERLMSRDDDPGWLVVDLVCRERMYGRLAAIRPEATARIEAELVIFEAYAGLAAAALDSASALWEARRQTAAAKGLLAEVERASATLAETEARYRSLVQKSSDLIVVSDASGVVGYASPASARILGIADNDLVGRRIEELIHPDDVQAVRDRLAQLDGQAGGSVAVESRMRHSNGAWRTVAYTATNLLADPAVEGYVFNGGDVTEVRQATQDLAVARDEALSASKVKSAFLATMSHEIRTPMNAVIGLTELLLDADLDAEQRELATGVKVSADNLLTIINDILDFSKIEAGKIELEEVALDLPSVADDVGRILAEPAHKKGLELLVDVHADVPTALLGDPVRIQQVLLNLASNAVKFTPSGEVVIRISPQEIGPAQVRLRCEVTDTGIGIAPVAQGRLFLPFSQADSSTTRKFGGTGLGLAISRQLVELMGGTLSLASAPGHGSSFWFELILRRPDAAAVQTPAVTLRSLEGRRALVVDDNDTNRLILRKQLLAWGVETVEAADGVDGLGEAAAAVEQQRPFDIGILDLNMPGMDGIELAATLKADPATTAITLFLLSSSGQRLSAAEAERRGLAGTLTKPVRQSELYDCLIAGLNGGASPDQPEPTPTPADEPGERRGQILLVEDNKMNQLVASKVLAKLGYRYDIANHGGEAVAALKAGSYDAVLMDCQMPEMDGYEATAEIRRIEGAERHTPIIAMTAAAMEGDRETCLAAGMDDYITKPVRPEAISAVLDKWILRQTVDTPEVASETQTLDPEQIELLRSLDDGDGAVLAEIIDEYLTQTARDRGLLADVASEGDPEALHRVAHALKGASANVGATTLATVCAEIEARGRFEQLDGLAELLARFDAEFSRVRDALTGVATRT